MRYSKERFWGVQSNHVEATWVQHDSSFEVLTGNGGVGAAHRFDSPDDAEAAKMKLYCPSSWTVREIIVESTPVMAKVTAGRSLTEIATSSDY